MRAGLIQSLRMESGDMPKQGVEFKVNGKKVKAVVNYASSAYNCGYREVSMHFPVRGGWGGLNDDEELLALKFLSDVIKRSILHTKRALHLSSKPNQLLFNRMLTKTGRWKLTGTATHNSLYGEKIVNYAIAFPYDENLKIGTMAVLHDGTMNPIISKMPVASVANLYKMYSVISEPTLISSNAAGW